MDTILAYIKWRKDIRFSERAFNDVDALVFATLAYANWDSIVEDEAMPLGQASQLFMMSNNRVHDAKIYAHSPEVPSLVQAMIDAERYKHVQIMKYVNILDIKEVVQFSAVSFILEDGTKIIAYRGTDSNLIGWKEDFYMTFKEEIPAQKYALAYLEENVAVETKKRFALFGKKENNVYIVGHSKGGNLAMYASIKAKALHSQITRVYNFDGPGFSAAFYDENEMAHILPKIKMYLPRAAIIGRLFEHREEQIIIEGYDSGLMQHSSFRWQVKNDGFVIADAFDAHSNGQIAYIDKILLSKNIHKKEKLVCSVFDMLEKLNIDEISDLTELNLKRGFGSVKEFGLLSNEDKLFFFDCLRFIVMQTKDAIFKTK